MELLTNELVKRFAKVGRQEEVHDPLVIAKFFNPAGAGTWYATEYDPKDRIFFGFVSIFGDYNDEWGSFAARLVSELRGICILEKSGSAKCCRKSRGKD